MSGPEIVSDIVDVYVFRRVDGRVDLLQLRRTQSPYAGSWQPVMGHVEDGERAEQAALRELAEETGATTFIGFWALDRVRPFYLAWRHAVVIAPRFACEVKGDWTPQLNDEHDAWRWVPLSDIDTAFMWPGQRDSIRDMEEAILRPGSLCRDALRIHPKCP